MEYFNYYYEDFLNVKLNLTDKVILSIISSFNEYEVNYQELNELLGITVSNIKLSVKKLKDLNLVQGNDKLELTQQTKGRYFKVDIEAGLNIKQLLLKYYIVHLPYKAFFGSLDTLSKVLQISKPTITGILNSLIEKDRIRKEKYNKCFKYTIIDNSSDEVEEEIEVKEQETIEEIPTADINALNQRLTKASEVCKQLMNENEALNKIINQQQEIINQQQEQINQLKKSLTIYIDKFNKMDKVFQPLVEYIDEVNSDLESLYCITNNKRAKCESQCDIINLRNILHEL